MKSIPFGQNTMKWVLVITGTCFLIMGFICGYIGKTSLVNYCLWCGFGLIVAGNLDRIEKFKWSSDGIEAQTREVIERAEIAVSELQLLAVHLATLSLSLVKRQGRLGGYKDDEQEQIRSSVFNVLTKLSITPSQTEQVLDEWHRFVEFDYAHFILGGSNTPLNASPEVLSKWRALRGGGIAGYPAPHELRIFLTKNNFISEELEERLKDYEYYIQHRTHRRPSSWKDRQNWGAIEQK
jgi:hypothetical protein